MRSSDSLFLFLSRIIVWGSRLLAVVVAFWWPGIWRDPIYTPRQARLAGQELSLPDGTVPMTSDEHALAIFWAWEHRKLVTTRWVTGPYQGLRNPQGWKQTLLVIIGIWIVGSGALLLLAWLAPHTFAQRQQRRGGKMLLIIPLWRFLMRQRQNRLSF
jgi:hypothetical protein